MEAALDSQSWVYIIRLIILSPRDTTDRQTIGAVDGNKNVISQKSAV